MNNLIDTVAQASLPAILNWLKHLGRRDACPTGEIMS